MSRLQGRSPAPRDPSAARRQLRRELVTSSKRPPQRNRPGGDIPSSRSARRSPPVLAFALVMLGLSALVGLIGGVALLADQPLVGVAFLVFGVLAAAAAWSLARREPRGYWASVVLLSLIGAVPAGFAISAGSVAAAVVLVPPLLMAAILLMPRVRADLIASQDPPG